MTQERSGGGREAARLEAFSDGVMAVIITIMAFSLGVPRNTTWHAVAQQVPSLLVYILSFAMIGIYWSNYHHLLRATRRISGAVMWANLHLLFWLSLIPVATKWVGRAHQASLPASAYGIAGFGSAVAYALLVQMIIRANGRESPVARAIGSDTKSRLSLCAWAAGAGLAWLSPWIAYTLYGAVALLWFVPDRRLTSHETV
jgi:TMEM175 potassium channel family protein